MVSKIVWRWAVFEWVEEADMLPWRWRRRCIQKTSGEDESQQDDDREELQGTNGEPAHRQATNRRHDRRLQSEQGTVDTALKESLRNLEGATAFQIMHPRYVLTILFEARRVLRMQPTIVRLSTSLSNQVLPKDFTALKVTWCCALGYGLRRFTREIRWSLYYTLQGERHPFQCHLLLHCFHGSRMAIHLWIILIYLTGTLSTEEDSR